jgi:hypothetical protein
MDDDEDEDREARVKRVLREARETIARLKRKKERERATREIEEMEPDDLAKRLIPCPLTRNERRRREASEFAAARERAKAEIATPTSFNWSAFDARIEAAIERERALICEVVGEVVATLRAEARKADRGAELSGEVTALWNALADAQRAIADVHKDRIDRALHAAPVIDAKTVN